MVGSVYAEGYSQCLTCGYGLDCAVGGVVGRYGFLEKIGPEHCPPRFAEQESGAFQAHKVGKTLGSILRARL